MEQRESISQRPDLKSHYLITGKLTRESEQHSPRLWKWEKNVREKVEVWKMVIREKFFLEWKTKVYPSRQVDKSIKSVREKLLKKRKEKRYEWQQVMGWLWKSGGKLSQDGFCNSTSLFLMKINWYCHKPKSAWFFLEFVSFFSWSCGIHYHRKLHAMQEKSFSYNALRNPLCRFKGQNLKWIWIWFIDISLEMLHTVIPDCK